MRFLLILVLSLFLLEAPASGQYGKGTGLFTFKPLSENPVQNSLFAIDMERKPSLGTCFYVGNNTFMTARHCVLNSKNKPRGELRVYSPHLQSEKYKVFKITASDVVRDLALIEVKGKLPKEAKPIKLAKNPATVGDKVQFLGYAGFSKPRHCERVVLDCSYGPCWTVLSGLVIGGDSGGMVLNSKNELVGVIVQGRTQIDTPCSYWDCWDWRSPRFFATTIMVSQPCISKFLK